MNFAGGVFEDEIGSLAFDIDSWVDEVESRLELAEQIHHGEQIEIGVGDHDD